MVPEAALPLYRSWLWPALAGHDSLSKVVADKSVAMTLEQSRSHEALATLLTCGVVWSCRVRVAAPPHDHDSASKSWPPGFGHSF